jgi:FtsP/CotA-like multicopper oxidase with cupredoxin domain
MTTRRRFLAYSGGTTLTLYACDRLGIKHAIAAIPGGSLDPAAITKYATPLLIPPVMPKAGAVVRKGGKNLDYYEISMRQFQQQILPTPMPKTTVWGYGPAASRSSNGLRLHNAPSLTIEARYGQPVRVKWINDLRDASGSYLPHLLPVDPTLHWANPPGGVAGRDTRPSFTSTPGPYTGPVPIVTHVHGAVGVGDESDGYAEAWYLPAAANIPAGHATEGTWYDFFKGKAAAKFGATWGAGYATFQYPNLGRAAQDWYHDHALGMTRLNVYAGPAGFYILRGGPAGDDAVKDNRSRAPARLPGPAPTENYHFPAERIFEIPIAIQDRSFNADGSLFYPNSREFFDGIAGPFTPVTDVSPIWNPEFFGNTIIVNGNTWPHLEVQTRRYRLRLINGCQSRFLILDFGEIANVEVWQIGNDGGFLAAPVNLSARNGNKLLMAPAERADLIVDFARVPPNDYVLGNVGPDEPFKGFNPDGTLADGEGGRLDPADPGSTGKILQFRVRPALAADPTTPPQFMQLPPIAALPAATVTRKLALIEEMSEGGFEDAPVAAVLGTVDGSGGVTPLMWMDPVTENPVVGAVEIWEIYNTTADAHPMHVHEVKFELVDRQPISIDEEARAVTLDGGARAPEPWERGFKDTVIAYPGEVTRIRAQFANPGQFVWHCHIVEHEDNEMMRPYRIGPEQPGQPGQSMPQSMLRKTPKRLGRRRKSTGRNGRTR